MRDFRLYDRKKFSNIPEEEFFHTFINEIYNDKPISFRPELEPFRYNIKLLLESYEIDKPNSNHRSTDLLWIVFINLSVGCSIELGDIKIDKKFLHYLVNDVPEYLYYERVILILFAMYKPQKVKDFVGYLYQCRDICDWFINDNEKVNDEYDLGNEEINTFHKYLKELLLSGYNLDTISEECEMISFIFGYIHYYKKDRYDLIKEYLDNIQYYKDKMELNKLFPYEDSGIELYDDNNAKKLFIYLEKFFEGEKGIIR